MIDYNTNLTLKNGIILKNRIIVPPMASKTADLSGFVTEDTIEHYKRLSKANASLIYVEYSFVHDSGKSETNQLGVASDKHIGGLAKISSIIKKSGSIAALQLAHGGGKSSTEITGPELLGPSPVAVPVKDNILETPRAMTIKEVEQLKTWFLNAARRGFEAGFDMVEFHAAHGYGLNQWLSPITNKRIDEYGGNLERRFKIISDIVKEAREKYPHKLFSIRIPGEDHFDGGLSLGEMITISQKLEQLGIDIISVSSGIGGWKRPKQRTGEGYLVEEAGAIQRSVQLPIIGVGGIKTKNYINKALSINDFSLAGVGRAILENPSWEGNP